MVPTIQKLGHFVQFSNGSKKDGGPVIEHHRAVQNYIVVRFILSCIKMVRNLDAQEIVQKEN
jgi:hypothetical protein